MKLSHSPIIPVRWLQELSITYGIPYTTILELFDKLNYSEENLLKYLNEYRNNQVFIVEKIPKLTVFQNGILAKNHFYDFAVPENKGLLNMIENNEFDYEIFQELFGNSNNKYSINSGEDVLIERRNDCYRMDLSELKRSLVENSDEETVKRLKRMSLDVSIDESNTHLIYKYVIGKGKVLIKNDISPVNMATDQILANSGFSEICLPSNVSLGNLPTVRFKLVYKNKESDFLVDQSLKIEDILNCVKMILKENVSISLDGRIVNGNESVLALKYCMGDLVCN